MLAYLFILFCMWTFSFQKASPELYQVLCALFATIFQSLTSG